MTNVKNDVEDRRSSEDTYVDEYIEGYTKTERNNGEQNLFFLKVISILHLMFITLLVCFLLAFGTSFILTYHNNEISNITSSLSIIVATTGLSFTVPSAVLFTYIRLKANINNITETKINLIIFYVFIFVPFGIIIPICLENDGRNDVLIGGLLCSCLFGIIMMLWTSKNHSILQDFYLSNDTKMQGSTWFFMATFVTLPFVMLFSALLIPKFGFEINNFLSALVTIFTTSSTSSIYILRTYLHCNDIKINYKNSLHRKRKLLVTIANSIIVCCMIVYPTSNILSLLLFEDLSNINTIFLLQILTIFAMLGTVITAGLYIIERKEVRKYLQWKYRCFLFLFYICCIVIPMPFLLPLPILRGLQNNVFFGVFFSIFVFGLMSSGWIALVVLKMNLHKQKVTGTESTKKPEYTIDDSDDDDEKGDKRINRKQTLYNIAPEDKKYFKGIWMIPSVIYIMFISYTAPLLITVSLSENFRNFLLGEDVEDAALVISILLLLFGIGIGHLLFHVFFLNHSKWQSQNYYKKTIDLIVYHVTFVMPIGLTGFLYNNDNNTQTNASLVFVILGILYFAWCRIFFIKQNIWKYTRRERLSITLLYTVTIVIPTPCIILYWIRYGKAEEFYFSKGLLSLIHGSFLAGILWLCTIHLSHTKFMRQQHTSLQTAVVFILVIPGTMPISSLYIFIEDASICTTLLCISIAAFHLVLILLLIGKFWPTNRVELALLFIFIYTTFVVTSVSSLIYDALINAKVTNSTISFFMAGLMLSIYLIWTACRKKFKSLIGRHLIQALIIICFFVVPVSLYPIHPSNARAIILFILFGVQAISWEYYDLNKISKNWNASIKSRIFLCIIWHSLCAFPISLILVGFEDSVTRQVSGLIFLPFCILVGVTIILFCKLYFLDLVHYGEPIQCVFLLSCNVCVMAAVMAVLQLRHDKGNPYILECIIVALIPSNLLGTFYFQLWKVRFVDKFVLTSIFGVLLPLMVFFKNEIVLNAADSRIYAYLVIILPLSSITLTMAPKLATVLIFKLPTLLNIILSGIFLPFGATLPVYLGLGEDRKSVTVNRVCLFLIITLPLLTMFINGIIHYEEISVRLKLCRKKPVVAVNGKINNTSVTNTINWISHLTMLVSLIFLLTVEKYVSNESSSYSIYIIFCTTPLIYVFNTRHDTTRLINKYALVWQVSLAIIIVVGIIVFAIGHVFRIEIASSIGLTITIILPGMWLIYAVLHATGRCIHLHPDRQQTMSLFSLFCCVGVFVPFGVVLPSILSTNWKSNETYAISLLFTVSLLALICLFDVSSLTIGINSTFNTIQKERKAKAATAKLLAVAKKHGYHIGEDVARALYDEALNKKHEWKTFEKEFDSEKFLVRLQRKNKLHLIDIITLRTEITNRSLKLCPNCEKSGWKVAIKKRTALCKTCLLAELLKKKREIARKKLQTKALLNLNRKLERERLVKEKQKRHEQKLKYASCIKQISFGQYKEAHQALNKLIEEDELNAEYYCRRSVVLFQLHRNNESLLDAIEALHINPKFAEAYLAKATCLASMKEWKKTVETYKRGLLYFPKNKLLLQGLKISSSILMKNSSETGIFRYLVEMLKYLSTIFSHANSAIDDVLKKKNIQTFSSAFDAGLVVKNKIKINKYQNIKPNMNDSELYDGRVFRIQIVNIKGLNMTERENFNELTPICCRIHVVSPVAFKSFKYKLSPSGRFSKQTHKLSNLDDLVWFNEFLYLRWWACKHQKLQVDVLGTKKGKSFMIASNFIDGHKIARFARGNEYVHIPMVMSSFMNNPTRFEVGLAFALVEKKRAVNMLHSQYNADFLRSNFLFWKKKSIPPKKVRLRIFKEVFTYYSTLKLDEYSKKRRVSRLVIHQISFRSKMMELQKQVDKNAEDNNQNQKDISKRRGEQPGDIVLKKSTTILEEGRISQKQFDKFVADSITEDFFPTKLFAEEARFFAKEHHQSGAQHNYVDFAKFSHILKVIAKRINPSVPLEIALQLFIDNTLHKCLPMYNRWRKIHGIRIQTKNSFKLKDPRDIANYSFKLTYAANLIQKWWRSRRQRVKAATMIQKWYRHRKLLREQYPEKQLNKQLIGLMNTKIDDDSDDEDHKNDNDANENDDTSNFVRIPKAFSCIKQWLVPLEIGASDDEIDTVDTNEKVEVATSIEANNHEDENLNDEEKCNLIIKEINNCRVEWQLVRNNIYPALAKEISEELKKSSKLNESEQVVNWKIWDNISTFYIGMAFTMYQYVSVALTNGPLAVTTEKLSNKTSAIQESSRDQLKKQLREYPWLMRLLDLLIYIPQFKLPEEFGNSFHYFFWFSVIVALAYPFYSIKGLKALRKGNLGLDNNGRPIDKCCTKDGLYNFGLNAVNDYLYFGMMFTLISSYACTYDAINKEFMLMADEQVKCFTFSEPLQIFYMVVAAMALLGFYPLATLLAPNFQFNNKALDIKYDQSFLIMEHQAELVMAGFSIFYQEDWVKVLVPQFIICLTLSISNQYIQPCMIKRLNIFRTAIYLCATHACACAILYNITENNSLLTWLTLILGWTLIWSLIIWIHKRKMKEFKLNKVVPLNEVKILDDDKPARSTSNEKQNITNGGSTADKSKQNDGISPLRIASKPEKNISCVDSEITTTKL